MSEQPSPADKPARPQCLLLVEDDPSSRELLARILHLKFPGQSILVAENGQVGLQLFRAHQPAIVLTDIKMPVMDGMAMGREIRRLAPHVCLIALTAHSNLEGDLDDQEHIFDRLVFKPVRIQELQEAIEACASATS